MTRSQIFKCMRIKKDDLYINFHGVVQALKNFDPFQNHELAMKASKIIVGRKSFLTSEEILAYLDIESNYFLFFLVICR